MALTSRFWTHAVFALGASVLLIGCPPSSPKTVRVDSGNTDATLPTVLTLQGTAPGQDTKIVMVRGSDPNFPDVSVEVQANDKVALTLVAKDDESGIQRLELATLVTKYRLNGSTWRKTLNNASKNFGASVIIPRTLPTDFPIAQVVNVTLDFAELTKDADWVIINAGAVAESGAPGLAGRALTTNTMTFYFKKANSPPGTL